MAPPRDLAVEETSMPVIVGCAAPEALNEPSHLEGVPTRTDASPPDTVDVPSTSHLRADCPADMDWLRNVWLEDLPVERGFDSFSFHSG